MESPSARRPVVGTTAGAAAFDAAAQDGWIELLGGEPLPVPDERLRRCRRLLGSRHSSLGDVAQLIRADAALSLHVLRRVNRVRHDNGREPDVLCVEIAANLLGEHALRDCLESCPELDRRLPRDGAHDSARRVYLRQLDHARLTAAVAEAAARARGDRSAGELYMLALLRGVPALALGLHHPKRLAELRRLVAGGLSLNAAARRILGQCWEALLRQLLVQRWRLPAALSPADGWPAEVGQRDLGPVIAGELVTHADLAGWYDVQLAHCEYLLGEYLWADRRRARAVWQRALLDDMHSGDWLGDTRLAQSLLDPPPEAAPIAAPPAVAAPAVAPVAAPPVAAPPVAAPPVAAPPAAAAPVAAAPPSTEGDARPTTAPAAKPAKSAPRTKATPKRLLAAAVKVLHEQESSQAPDVSQVLRALLQGLTGGIELQQAGIFVIDRSDDLLRARATLGQGSEGLRSLCLQRDTRWLTGDVLRRPSYLHIGPVDAERWQVRIPPGLRELGWHHDFLIASLFAGERPLALLLGRGEVLRNADSAARARALHKLANRALANFAVLKSAAGGPAVGNSAAGAAAGKGVAGKAAPAPAPTAASRAPTRDARR